MSAHDELAAACNALDEAVVEYDAHAQQAAEAEATYRSERAKHVLTARADGARSIAEAETKADADDDVARLLLDRLSTAALADANKQRILSLREKIGALRSYLADARAADQIHATRRDIA